jgi:hypothetical protein
LAAKSRFDGPDIGNILGIIEKSSRNTSVPDAAPPRSYLLAAVAMRAMAASGEKIEPDWSSKAGSPIRSSDRIAFKGNDLDEVTGGKADLSRLQIQKTVDKSLPTLAK